MFRAVMAAVVAGLAWGAWAEGDLPDDRDFETLTAEFQTVLDELRGKHGFPGATAAFVLADGRVGAAATGLSDRASGRAMLPDDRMFSGSIGKTFVSALVLALVGEGKLALNAPIATWLGEEPWFEKLANGERITVRQLLNHSSGIPDHVDSAGFAFSASQRLATGRVDDPFTPAELVRFVLRKEPHFAPGEGFHYTDTGYILLGMIVEKVTGRTYYELVNERFLTPLHLSLTSPADSRQIPDLVSGYLRAGNAFGLPECSMTDSGLLVIHPGTEWTGGGLVTNSQDLVRWGKALYHDRVLGDAMTALMLTETSEIRQGSKTFHYGLGVFIVETELGTTYGHGGWYPGYNSQLEYFPDREFAVAIQINRDFDNPRQEYIQALAAPIARMLAMLKAP